MDQEMQKETQYQDEICYDPDILRTPSEPTTLEEITGLDLIERLKAAMKKAWVKGHGLAAIQIGLPIRAAVFQSSTGAWVTLINPKLLEKKDYRAKRSEGCLSIPQQWFSTYRYEQVKIENGPAENRHVLLLEGLDAWIVQHEIDHMDGILCFQRMKTQERNAFCACGSGIKFKKCCGR